MKNKSDESYEADTSIFVVVYGVSGTHNDVETSIWDRVYYIENKIVHFEAPIDLNSNGISGLQERSPQNADHADCRLQTADRADCADRADRAD